MSLYEVLAIVALAGVGGFAYYLYRSDMRSRPPGQAADSESTSQQLMFGRTPRRQPSSKDKPGS